LVAAWLPKIKLEQSRAQTTVAEIASRRGFKKSRPLSKDYRNEFAEIQNSKNELFS
jgi:transcriptional regulator GlxA family with amidase domain